jgi:gliding motility-associated lipoprotein GldH
MNGIQSWNRFIRRRWIFQQLIWLTLIFLAGCDSNTLYDDTKPIPGGVWNEKNTITFKVPVTDTVNIHKFYLGVRHTTGYRFANLFLFINTTFPDGKNARDTVECILADRSGKWLGKGITDMRDNQVLLRRGLKFPQAGTYVFEIEQAMREQELEGISDIGLRIARE